jgi:hypothetical protein
MKDVLNDLIAGWQKVADRYGLHVYIFRSNTPLGYSAVTNKAQVIGPILVTIPPLSAPVTARDRLARP